MKKLTDLIADFEHTTTGGDEEREISALVFDNRKLESGCAFVCIIGQNFDGHSAAAEAAGKGAAAIVVSKDVELPDGCDTCVIRVEDTRYALACMSAAWFDHPARELVTIGVTGTKGKTTTTYLIKSILEKAGRRVGLVGTIESIIGDERIPSKNTTPESYVLQETFRKMVDAGLDTVVMEASSQGFMLHRTAGFVFDYGIFTNISEDHIGPGEHSDFEDYLRCKGMLFRQCRVGIINGDDQNADRVINGHTCGILKFGFSDGCDLRASDMKLVNGGDYLGVDFKVSGSLNFDAQIDMPGEFSVYNALCAIAVCAQMSREPDSDFRVSTGDIQEALKSAQVKGRIEFQKVSDSFSLMIDYAHNAMALESLLTTLRAYDPGRLVCLFGCGGNRSKLRRYEMGEVSGRLADLTVITSDNPRFEEPQDIIEDIKQGIGKTDGKYVEICDRKEAIRYVIKNGQKGDVIVLAGKGHEDYQEIRGQKHHMDERELIQEILNE